MQPSLIGQTLGKYRILEEIGRGGMGVVYKAHDTVLDRPVAIKVLAPHLTWDQEFVKRFLREARTAARLKHPNIVTIYDVGQAQGHHFIAMDYLEGRSLAEIIRRQGPLPPERVAHLLAQIAQALDYAHARQLIHRDVKPGNVIVGPRDHATLTDFGVARSLEGTRLTQSGVMVGTPSYMSPEQVQGQTVGPATDVYALGIVAYEMLGGRPPFEGETPRLLHAHVYEEPPPLPQVNPNVAPVVGTVVKKALAKEPGKRYGSAGAFAAALGQVIGLRERGGVPPPPPPVRRTPLWPLFGALGAVLLVVVMVFWGVISKPDAQDVATQTAVAQPAATETAVSIATVAQTTATLTIVPTATPTTMLTSTHTPTPMPISPSSTPVPPTPTPIIIVITATPIPPTPTPIIIVVTATPIPPTPTEVIGHHPTFGPISFCLQVGSDNRCISPTNHLPSGITRFYVSWSFQDVPLGTRFHRIWYRDGKLIEELTHRNAIWNEKWNSPTGVQFTWVQENTNFKIVDGQYKLELYFERESEPIQQATVQVGP